MSVAHITRDMRKFLVRAAAVKVADIQELCRTGPIPQWMRCFEEGASSLIGSSARESGLSALPRQHCGAGLGARGVSELARGHKCGRADPATPLPWDGTGTEVTPLPLATLAVRKAAHRVIHEHGRASPTPQQLQHLGEQAQFLT